MCGIAGFATFAETGDRIDPRLMPRMLAALQHRGPDASGMHAEPHCTLGHTRLSIIDLAGGVQPMSNEDGSVWVTFNGEIFNYRELRSELVRNGHQFRTQSDTEVILHAYEDFGPDCVHRFNGQWAFAVWDSRERRLFLSRDRFGIRPLFYTSCNGTLLFASEVKALFQHPDVPRELDPRGLDQTLTFWAPIAPRTAFAGISQLPPGHNLIVDRSGSRTKRYWDLDFSAVDESRELNDCRDELDFLLHDATRLQMRSDVPVGTYLSGGLDSSVTTALARSETSDRLCSFSVAFDDARFDERTYQEQVARHLATEHHVVRASSGDIADVFPDVVRHTEQPILRTAPAPLYLLSRLVKELGLKVVLTGEGADEVLGGYDIFKETRVRQFWARRPESTVRPMLLRRLYPYLDTLHQQSDAYLRAFFRVNGNDLASPFFSHLPRWDLTSRIKAFFSPEIREELHRTNPLSELQAALPPAYFDWPPVLQAQYLESTLLLPGYILHCQSDRMAMAHGIEGRFPFLDHRLAEFAARLPLRFKLSGLNEKYLLKQLAKRWLPENICRRSKQPYRAPDGECFVSARGGFTRDYVADALSERSLAQAGVFAPRPVERLVRKFRDGQALGTRDDMALVGILSTQLLHREFIERPQAACVASAAADPPLVLQACGV